MIILSVKLSDYTYLTTRSRRQAGLKMPLPDTHAQTDGQVEDIIPRQPIGWAANQPI